MKIYVWIDKTKPDKNLVIATSPNSDLVLEKIEVEVLDGEDVVSATKRTINI